MPDEDIVRSCVEQKVLNGYGPNPSCAVCHGAGVVHPLLDNGEPDYTRVISCQAPGCLESQKQAFSHTEAYIKAKGISKCASFDDFQPVLGTTDVLQAFRAIAFDKTAPPLLIVYGTSGNGKTHLCEATATELLKRGVDCRLWAVADLVSRLKESISDNSTEQMMSGLKKLPALILDDWGQNRGSAWELQKLEEIVVARERAGVSSITHIIVERTFIAYLHFAGISTAVPLLCAAHPLMLATFIAPYQIRHAGVFSQAPIRRRGTNHLDALVGQLAHRPAVLVV